MTNLNVSMPTIGRIIKDLLALVYNQLFVSNGIKLRNSFFMKRVVKMALIALCVMVGKNTIITNQILKSINAKNLIIVKYQVSSFKKIKICFS